MARKGKSSFRADADLAEQIERFVYEVVFLGKNSNSPLGVEEERVRLIRHDESPETQMAGGDIVLTTARHQDLNIDVKFATYYAGSDGAPKLETFAQELSFVRNNKWCPGWLIDQSKRTDVYAFGWVNSVVDSTAGTKGGYRHVASMSEVTECEIAFVRRENLLSVIAKYLDFADESVRVDKNNLISYLRTLDDEARCFRERELCFGEEHLAFEPCLEHLRVHYTTKLHEMPVNLLLPRKVLCTKGVAFHHLICRRQTDEIWDVIDLFDEKSHKTSGLRFGVFATPKKPAWASPSYVQPKYCSSHLGIFQSLEKAKLFALSSFLGNERIFVFDEKENTCLLDTGYPELCLDYPTDKDVELFEIKGILGSSIGDRGQVGVMRDGKYIDDYGHECDVMTHDGYTAYFDEDNGWTEL